MASMKKYPKKPKPPKQSASLTQHQNYVERVKEWEKKCAEVDKYNTALKNAQKKTNTLKQKVRSRKAK
ncbi:MAG: hypothetical protein AAF135_09515 [Bacteroidota bacterium]